MDVIDFGIGTQAVPLDDLAEILGVPPTALRAFLKESGLNLITLRRRTYVGLWQFRLLLTHLMGFHGKHYDLDRILGGDLAADPIPRMNHERLREAMGHLIIAHQAQKGSILTEVPKALDRVVRAWSVGLELARSEIEKHAHAIVDSVLPEDTPDAS